jgi:thiamine transporter ThiT
MASEVQTHNEPSVAGLVTGIIDDVQDLIKSQIQMARAEITKDFRRSKEAGSMLAIGAGVSLLATILLSLMLVYALHELAGLRLWASYAIVGGGFAVAGVALVFAGKKKFDAFNPLPDETAHALQENLEWKTKKTTTPT